MADERQQQGMVDSQVIGIHDQFSEIDSVNSLQDKELKVDPSEDSLLKKETNAFNETSSVNINQNLALNENIHHLSDHSYIHLSHTVVKEDLCNISSQGTNSSDNFTKQETDCKDVQLSTISLGVTNDTSVVDIHATQPSENPSEDTDKVCFNDNLLTIKNSDHCSNFNTLPVIESTKNSDSTTNSSCVKSAIETALLGNNNPLFVINRLDSTTLSATLSSPSTSRDLSTIKIPVKQTNAPLGSVQNPIQIIQKGTSYQAVQALTEAQKLQITHVLQRQQAKKALETEGKSVVYDPCTKTRIVCRIVHPSELQSKNSEASTSESSVKKIQAQTHQPNSFRGRGRPRKLQSRKIRDEEKANSELSKEEREEKKKHRPRTRSGRISKPPSYMVKDYKRIHHLDFNDEPFDDSDGGYSDYQVSDDEAENRAPKTNSLPPGVTTAKKRNYSCQSCSKAYIGRGGLSRHYRTHPSHGSLGEGEDFSTQDENSNSSLASSVLSNSGCNTSSQSFSSAMNNQLSSPSSNSQITSIIPHIDLPKITSDESTSAHSIQEKSNNTSKSETNNCFSSLQNVQMSHNSMINQNPESVCSFASNQSPESVSSMASTQRKARLREILKNYPEEDIFEVLLPRFIQQVSLWDFFIQKFSSEPNGLGIFEMLKEFEKFMSHMRVECHNCLLPVNLHDIEGKTIINISSKEIAAALSLETGPYMIKTSGESESSSAVNDLKLKNIACDVFGIQNEAPMIKRKRLDVGVEEVSSGLPEQILNDIIPENDDLPLTEDNLSNSVELASQDVTLLNSSISVDNHSDTVSKGFFDLGNNNTIVTPSSLSSGCLSAVNASKTPLISPLSTRIPQKLQNIQFRKLQFLGMQQQHLLSNNNVTISVPVNNLSVSNECSLANLPSNQQNLNKDSIIVQKPIGMCNGSMASKTFQGLPLESNTDIFNPSIHGLPAQAVIPDSNVESNNVATSVSLISTTNVNSQNVPSDTSQSTTVQSELAESIANCLSDSQIASSLHNANSVVTSGLSTLIPSEINVNPRVNEELRELEPTHNVISDVPKIPESSALLSQVMLSDGQVLNIWSPMENNEKISNDQFLQNFIPGNLIILQNPEGSIQVPNNQGVPAETLQNLSAINQGLGNETGSHAFTSVRPL